MPAYSLQTKFRSYIADNSLVLPGQKVLVAVSGGVDSMVMLHLFVAEGFDIGVAHCNFQLRGEESLEDEVMVERTAKELGVPFYNMRFDTAEEMDRTGESVQMAARRLRYGWFDSLCRDHRYDVIAIAHHADDSVETFFINLLRGTGLRGLTGINVTNGRIIRPLLFATRHTISEYAQVHKIEYRDDSSNRSTKYLRNKIRLGLIPRIKEINPRFSELMSGNVHRLTEAQLFITRCIEGLERMIVTREGDLRVIDPRKIDPTLPKGFVIYEILKADGFKGDVIDRLLGVLAAGHTGRRFYSKENVAYVDRGRIVVSPIAGDDECNIDLERHEQKAYCGNRVVLMEHVNIDDVDSLTVPANVALLDADKLQFPLRLRRWRDGDSFVPFGMEGRKKVSDFLIDEKVSAAEKTRQFVLVSGEDIAWLVGRRIDDRYRITPGTENVLKIISEII